MVQATGKLRTFDVEIRQRGKDPRLVATDVTIDVARSMCKEMVGPQTQAVVRPRVGGTAAPPVEEQLYAIWIWNDDKLRWEKVSVKQRLTLSQATAWIQSRSASLAKRLTVMAPAHLADPAEMLRHAR